MAPRWSILLPTHNNPDTIGYAIRSALIQSEENFELLIVGDGCCEKTKNVVASFCDDRVRFFDLVKSPGFGYANRNVALKEARGEFIAFLADDDLWLPDHLSILQDELSGDGIDLVCSQAVWLTPEGYIMPMLKSVSNPYYLEKFMAFEHNFIPAGSIAHKRECFENVGYWNDSLSSKGDWDLWIRILSSKEGVNFSYVPLVTNLHFRANWKTRENEGPVDMAHWRKLFTENDFLRLVATIPIPDEIKEQEVVFSLLSKDPEGFSKKLRRDIQFLTEMFLQSYKHESERSSRHLVLARKERQDSLTEVEVSRKELEKLKRKNVETERELMLAKERFVKLESKVALLEEEGEEKSLRIVNTDRKLEELAALHKEVLDSFSWKFCSLLQRGFEAVAPKPSWRRSLLNELKALLMRWQGA